MPAIVRTLRFTGFTLVEYLRSGRILIEVIAGVAVFYIFFRRWSSAMPPEYFFSTTGIFTLGLSFYTSATILGMGDRPEGYLLLARRLGHSGYLLGLYLAILVVIGGVYGAICLGVAFYNPVESLGIRGWALGSLPLLLNVAMLVALLTLLTPIVLPSGWRLAILAIVAIAFSGNLIGGTTMAALPRPLTMLLDVLRALFSTPLLPAFTGFALSASRDYQGMAFLIPLAQFSLTLSILVLAVYAFSRREIIFSGA